MARPSKKISNKKSEQKFQKPSKKSFKPTRKTDETQVLAMQLQDDVPDFPRATARGGRSSLGKEVDEVDGDDVDMEFESGERELNNNNYKNKNKRLQKRNHSAEEDDLGSLFGDGISGKLPRFANKITLKNISPGMKLWGVIAEVNEKDIVISLPGGLRGLVRASEAFEMWRLIFFLAFIMLGNWFLALYCNWVMIRKRRGNERSGFLCVLLCCIRP
ncbi:hypothetical protein CsSME_00035856 [Camellia sinensis var. sinensis]